MKYLIKYFLNNKILVNIITLLILAAGIFSLFTINREGYPQVDQKKLRIITFYPGASPEEVEINVTISLEEAIKSLEGIKEFSSVSRENFSVINVQIDKSEPNPEKIKSDIRREIDNVILPAEVTQKPEIHESKVSAWPIMEIGLFSDSLSYDEIRTRTKDLKKIIKKLNEISKIDEKGILDREVKIHLDLKKINEYQISIEEIIQAIKTRNFELTGGVLKEKDYDTIITVFSKFKNINDVAKIILRSNFDGNKLYLSDVAQIENSYKEENTRYHINGKKGVSLYINKKKSADIIRTVDKVKKVTTDYKKSLSKHDLDITFLWDNSTETRTRLGIVNKNAFIGLLLVLITLFIFMNFNNAFWTAMGIPFSIAFAIYFINFIGITINAISLLGIIVVLGMVVDDAIIISENIYRHRLNGSTWLQAAQDATLEVAYPVITTIITTIFAFLPLLRLKGVMGDFSKEIPIVITFVLLGSMIESLLILPSHLSHGQIFFNKNSTPKEKKFITWLKARYMIGLDRTLKNKYIIILIFIILFGFSYFSLFSGKIIKFDVFPSEDTTYIYIKGEVTKGQNLNYTENKVQIFEAIISQYSTNVIKCYNTQVGEIGYPEKFFIELFLTHPSKREITGSSIISNIRYHMADVSFFTNVFYNMDTGGPSKGRAIRIEIMGNDNNARRVLTDNMFTHLENLKGLQDLIRSDVENKNEVKILVNYEKAARLGVQPLSIGNTIRAAYNGVIVTSVQTPDDEIEYRVLLDKKYKHSMKVLSELYVLNKSYRLIPLQSIVDYTNQKMVNKIEHYNGDRTTILEADLDSSIITPKEVYDNIMKNFKDFDKNNPGFSLSIGGQAKESKETINSFLEIGIFVLILIFSILILLFRSITQALIVILAVPFSLIGINFVLLSHNMALSGMALFGLIGLIGVVVNDSLVMVDFINQQVKKNQNLNIIEVIKNSAVTRLRPILLTTITTVVGLIPTAYGFGGRDDMIIPTTRVIAWGLALSTFLTLFLIPSLYYIEYNIKNKFNRKKISETDI